MKRVAGNVSFYLGILLIALSTIMITQASGMEFYGEFGPGPGLFPMVVNVLLLICSVFYLIRTLNGKEEVKFSDILANKEGAVNILVTIVSPIILIVITPFTGFLIASIVMLFPLFSRGFKLLWSLLLSVAVGTVVVFLFNLLLSTPLPKGFLGI